MIKKTKLWFRSHKTNIKDALIFVVVFYAFGAVVDTAAKLLEPYGPHTSMPVRAYIRCEPDRKGAMLCAISFSQLRTVNYEVPND